MAKDPQDDDDLKLCSHTMMLPTRGQLEGRMIVTAYEHGLDNVTEEAVSAVVYAVEVSGRRRVTSSCVWLEVGAARKGPKCPPDLGSVVTDDAFSQGRTTSRGTQLPSVNRRSSRKGYLGRNTSFRST